MTFDDAVAAIEQFMRSDASDGLPIVPPGATSVAAMVAASGLPDEHVLGRMPPRLASVRVRDVAINAVMAGCAPEYMPVVVAAARGIMDERFDLFGVAASTKGAAPLVIVNGPVRLSIGVNCRGNVFGPGFRANATIGRTIRLLLLTVGQAPPNFLDRGTLGHSGRFSYCIGEDEEDSPWTPLHVERGLQASQSAVTVWGGEAPRQISVTTASPEAICGGLAYTLSSIGIGHGGPGAPAQSSHTPHVLVIAKEHRDILGSAGWSKADVRAYVAEHAVVAPEVIERMGGRPASGPQGVVPSSDDLLVIAAGGAAGRFSSVLPGWTRQSQPVTVEVEVPSAPGASWTDRR
jgi:hypothetical protein